MRSARVMISMLLIGATQSYAASIVDITQALNKAKAYLYERQENGHWEREPKRDMEGRDYSPAAGQWGGRTAVAVYALLAAGENHQDRRLAEAIEFLKKADLVGVYALSMRCQVWLLLPQSPDVKALMKSDAQRLMAMVKREGNAAGMYDYVATADRDRYSHSRAQYGVLGMWAAAQAGIDVPESYWQLVESGWLRNQDRGGGWTYQHIDQTKHPITPGMTAAGVATLFITQDFLHAKKAAACRGNVTNFAIDKGLAWIARNFDKVATDEEYPRDYPYATLYAVERIGLASGLRYIGDNDWYQKGADWLIANQNRGGSWSSDQRVMAGVPDTCFGILFLARGRAPLVMSKLDYSTDAKKPANWSQRPRDAANLTRWIARTVERELNWQIVTLDSPLADWHDAPILYLAGSQPLALANEHKQKLKTYVEQGGLILANADCGATAFATSVRKLAGEIFPGYEFRELPAEHPIFVDGPFARQRWRTRPGVLGLSNGVRELVLLIPQADFARNWQLNSSADKDPAWELPADLFLYAADRRNLRLRGESYLVQPDELIEPTRTLKVARLRHEGNWDPEPGGWRRLAGVMHNSHQIALSADAVDLSQTLPDDVRVAHLTGTGPLKFDAPARAAIRRFIESGGTMIIDAAGGSSDFAKSIEAELAAVFPDAKPEPLPMTHRVFSSGKKSTEEFSYRPAAQKLVGQSDAPRVRAIHVGGRAAVFYSRLDISAGLVGQPMEGIVGYSPSSATELMTTLLLFAVRDQP